MPPVGGSASRVLSLTPRPPHQEAGDQKRSQARWEESFTMSTKSSGNTLQIPYCSLNDNLSKAEKKRIKKMQTKSSALCLGPKVKPRAAPLGAFSRPGVPQAEGTAPATPRASPFQKPVLEAEGRESGRRRVATNPLSFPALCLQRRETVGTQYGAP